MSGSVRHSSKEWKTFPSKTLLSTHVVHDGVSRCGPSLPNGDQSESGDSLHHMGLVQMGTENAVLSIHLPSLLDLPIHPTHPSCATIHASQEN